MAEQQVADGSKGSENCRYRRREGEVCEALSEGGDEVGGKKAACMGWHRNSNEPNDHRSENAKNSSRLHVCGERRRGREGVQTARQGKCPAGRRTEVNNATALSQALIGHIAECRKEGSRCEKEVGKVSQQMSSFTCNIAVKRLH